MENARRISDIPCLMQEKHVIPRACNNWGLRIGTQNSSVSIDGVDTNLTGLRRLNRRAHGKSLKIEIPISTCPHLPLEEKRHSVKTAVLVHAKLILLLNVILSKPELKDIPLKVARSYEVLLFLSGEIDPFAERPKGINVSSPSLDYPLQKHQAVKQSCI